MPRQIVQSECWIDAWINHLDSRENIEKWVSAIQDNGDRSTNAVLALLIMRAQSSVSGMVQFPEGMKYRWKFSIEGIRSREKTLLTCADMYGHNNARYVASVGTLLSVVGARITDQRSSAKAFKWRETLELNISSIEDEPIWQPWIARSEDGMHAVKWFEKNDVVTVIAGGKVLWEDEVCGTSPLSTAELQQHNFDPMNGYQLYNSFGRLVYVSCCSQMDYTMPLNIGGHLIEKSTDGFINCIAYNNGVILAATEIRTGDVLRCDGEVYDWTFFV